METKEQKPQTLGEYRVAASTPSGNQTVDMLNANAAGFIDNAIAPTQVPKKAEPTEEKKEQAVKDDAAPEIEMETIDKRGVAQEFASLFTYICGAEAGKTDNFEAKRCFIQADKFMKLASGALANDAYGDAHALAEVAAMWAVKGVMKPAKPSHL